MHLALLEAQKAYQKSEVPVGAVIVNNSTDEIIAKAHNQVEEFSNVLYHAEISVIQQASKRLNKKYLTMCDLYITLEPCSMCCSAIAFSRIKRLFYGASDIKHGAVENNTRFFTTAACYHRPEVYNGISNNISQQLLKRFFQGLRYTNK